MEARTELCMVYQANEDKTSQFCCFPSPLQLVCDVVKLPLVICLLKKKLITVIAIRLAVTNGNGLGESFFFPSFQTQLGGQKANPFTVLLGIQPVIY